MMLFYSLYKSLYGYPCRGHVKLALQQNLINTSYKWRLAMLYICGENIDNIAKHLNISRERVRMTLNIIVMGVK